MEVTALLTAAGFGSRMKSGGVSKQYLLLGDRPILAHTLALFERHPLVKRIVMTVPADDLDFCRKAIVERYGFAKVSALVAGGTERQDSVRNGLEACSAAAEDIVLIHDGVRPFVTAETITAAVAAAQECGACVVGVPVKDTVKQVVGDLIVATPERKSLWLAQTPQAFRYALIRAAHRAAVADGFTGTDDAGLVERLGRPVAMVAGNYRNIKITTPEDLLIAGAFLAAPGETVS
jgi:2-C-methyl-D-erythritol 4-phosphate cytidylyltransferase